MLQKPAHEIHHIHGMMTEARLTVFISMTIVIRFEVIK